MLWWNGRSGTVVRFLYINCQQWDAKGKLLAYNKYLKENVIVLCAWLDIGAVHLSAGHLCYCLLVLSFLKFEHIFNEIVLKVFGMTIYTFDRAYFFPWCTSCQHGTSRLSLLCCVSELSVTLHFPKLLHLPMLLHIPPVSVDVVGCINSPTYIDHLLNI